MRLYCEGRDKEDEYNIIRFCYLGISAGGYKFLIEVVNNRSEVSPYSCHKAPALDKMLIVLMRRHFPGDDSFFKSQIQTEHIIITIRDSAVKNLSGAISKMRKLLKSVTLGFEIKYSSSNLKEKGLVIN